MFYWSRNPISPAFSRRLSIFDTPRRFVLCRNELDKISSAEDVSFCPPEVGFPLEDPSTLGVSYYSNKSEKCVAKGIRAALVSPIWYALITVALDLFPAFVLAGGVVAIITETFGSNIFVAYAIFNLIGSIGGFFSAIHLGNLSQPQRLGRKKALFLIWFASLLMILSALTANGYCLLIVEMVVTLSACKFPSGHVLVLAAWITDWSSDKQKTLLMTLIGCSSTLTLVVGNFVGGYLLSVGVEFFHLVLLTLLIKIISLMFIAFVFPADRIVGDNSNFREHLICTHQSSREVEYDLVSDRHPLERNTAMRSSTSYSREPQNYSSSMKVIRSTFRYLLKEHCLLLSICVLYFLANQAMFTVVLPYLVHNLNFSPALLSTFIGTMAACSCVAQLVSLPFMRSRRYLHMLAVLGCLSEGFQFLFLGMAAEPHLVFVGGIVGVWGGVLNYVLMGFLAKCTPDGHSSEEANQGAILGAYGGLRLVCAAIGPLILAFLFQEYTCLPAPLNFASFGFVFLSCLMFVAVGLAILFAIRSLSNPRITTSLV